MSSPSSNSNFPGPGPGTSADATEHNEPAARESYSNKSSDAEDNSKSVRTASENSKELEKRSLSSEDPVNVPSNTKSRKFLAPFGKLPVIFTYPSKNRPRQPFMNQPAASTAGRPRTSSAGSSAGAPGTGPSTGTPGTGPSTRGPQTGVAGRTTPTGSVGRGSRADSAPRPITQETQQREPSRPEISPPAIRPVLRRLSQTLPPRSSGPLQPPTFFPNQLGDKRAQEPAKARGVSFQSPAVQPQLPVMPNSQSMFSNMAYWAPYPEEVPSNIPPCLAHLLAADSLYIVQQLDLIELFLNVEEPNFYLIQNKDGQCVYYAYETSDICGQVCCTHSRGFQLHVMDMYHNEIIYMNRPCGFKHFFCCYPVMEVYSPPLVPVGAIQKIYHPTHQEFVILDADENRRFKIHGPCCLRTCSCCAEARFTIHAMDNNDTEVGVIKREWGGVVRTHFTNADYYGITFPVDLDVRIKAVFLGALFFIDYTFYEGS